MTKLIDYNGIADERIISSEAFGENGIEHDDVVFNKENNFLAAVSNEAAIFLLASDTDFTAQDGSTIGDLIGFVGQGSYEVYLHTDYLIDPSDPGNLGQFNSLSPGFHVLCDKVTGEGEPVPGIYLVTTVEDGVPTLELATALFDGNHNGAFVSAYIRITDPNVAWGQGGPWGYSIFASEESCSIVHQSGPGFARFGSSFTTNAEGTGIIPGDARQVYVVDNNLTEWHFPDSCSQSGNEFFLTFGELDSGTSEPSYSTDGSGSVSWLTVKPWQTGFSDPIFIKALPDPWSNGWKLRWINAPIVSPEDLNAAIEGEATARAAAIIAAQVGAVFYRGVIDCSSNPNYPAANAGDFYVVSVSGKIGGSLGIAVEAGDVAICQNDGTLAGTQGAVGSSWDVIQKNIDGAVVGPSSAASGRLASFTGTSGKIIQDSGVAVSTDGTLGAGSGSNAKMPTEQAVKAGIAASSLIFQTSGFGYNDGLSGTVALSLNDLEHYYGFSGDGDLSLVAFPSGAQWRGAIIVKNSQESGAPTITINGQAFDSRIHNPGDARRFDLIIRKTIAGVLTATWSYGVAYTKTD